MCFCFLIIYLHIKINLNVLQITISHRDIYHIDKHVIELVFYIHFRSLFCTLLPPFGLNVATTEALAFANLDDLCPYPSRSLIRSTQLTPFE